MSGLVGSLGASNSPEAGWGPSTQDLQLNLTAFTAPSWACQCSHVCSQWSGWWSSAVVTRIQVCGGQSTCKGLMSSDPRLKFKGDVIHFLTMRVQWRNVGQPSETGCWPRDFSSVEPWTEAGMNDPGQQ